MDKTSLANSDLHSARLAGKFNINTVCQRSLAHYYIVSCCTKMDKTSGYRV